MPGAVQAGLCGPNVNKAMSVASVPSVHGISCSRMLFHCCRRNIEIKPKVFLRKKILELDLHFIEVFTVEKY